VHPTPSAKDNIAGFIALIQQKTSAPSPTSPKPTPTSSASSYLLAWVPEFSLAQNDLNTYVKVDMADNTSPPKQTYLVPPVPTSATLDESSIGRYAFALPLSSIYSILIRPPSLGWWFGSVVINTRAGSSLPALFFHDSECESTILQRKKRARESFDPFGEHGGLFWGGDEVVRWLKRYVEVERSGADPGVYLINPSEEDRVGFGETRKSLDDQRDKSSSRRNSKVAQQERPQTQPGPSMDPLTKALKETRWKVLEQLSKITTFTRRTAQDIADNPKLPPQMRRLIQNPEVQTLQDEFDSARLYLARWAMGIAEQSEREKRQRIYTAEDVLKMEESSVGEFEILDMEAGRMSIGGDNKRKPVTSKEWQSYFDSKTGRLQVTVDEVKERIFHGGLDPEDGVRKEAWLFLLGVYSWESTSKERLAVMNSKRDEFIRLKGAWWGRMVDGDATPEQEEWWKEQKGRIGKSITLSSCSEDRWALWWRSPLCPGLSSLHCLPTTVHPTQYRCLIQHLTNAPC
jgi:TBC1 domain family member 15